MKIHINPSPIAQGIVELEKLKKDYQQDLNLKRAINKNTKITKGDLSEEEFKKAVFLCMDWTTILTKLTETSLKQMKIKIHSLTYEDRPILKPGYIKQDMTELELKQTQENGTEFIIINNLITSPDWTIRTWINLFTYLREKESWQLNYKL